MAKGGKLRIKDEHIWWGLGGVIVIGGGIYYLLQNPQLQYQIMNTLGIPSNQPAVGVAQPQENLEMEEMEALRRGMDPYKPTVGGNGFQLTQGAGGYPIPSAGNVGGGTHMGETQQGVGPFGVRFPIPGGPGAGGFTQSPRCAYNPSDLPIATLETAKQMVRILDFPVTPVSNTIPRLEQCFYREIANYVNAGPSNPVYLAVEQAACAISSGSPFPVRNAASLRAAQVAKRQINQGNCYNQTFLPVPKRAMPVPVLETARARAYKARIRGRRSMMNRYAYYAHGGR